MASDLDLGEDYLESVVFYLVKNYGDLLKVSRERFCLQSLPKLRKYVENNPEIVDGYYQAITDEIIGQGLEGNAEVKGILEIQCDRFRTGSAKDSSAFARDIEKLIKAGKVDRVPGTTMGNDSIDEDSTSEFIEQIINEPSEVDADKISKAVATEVRQRLLASFEVFAKWAFHIQNGYAFQEQDFHKVMFSTCQKVVEGEIDRLIISIPPRHSKTQILSIALPLYSFCHNPGSHNIITSYADDVVQESSGYIRAVMTDKVFEKVFPRVRIDPNKRSLERWGTTRSGVMHAVPTGGKMTGKGAGLLSDKYSGLFVVDDAIKPKDAYSNAIREEINDRFDNTFMSRLANDGMITVNGKNIPCPRTPMVIIMQRVHDTDLVGYLLRGGSSDKYHYLNIPGIVTPETGSAEYYDRLIKKQNYTHAIPILYHLEREEPESALWASRKSLTSLKEMKKTNPYTYNSQYDGDPTSQGTGLIKEEWWQEYDPSSFDMTRIVKAYMTADTASTEKTYSDYSAVFYWGITAEKDVICLDILLGKFEVPKLIVEVRKFWETHNRYDFRYPCLIPRAMYLEDKASGQFLNQQFISDGSVRVSPVPRDSSGGDKVARFLNTVPFFAQGRFYFPAGHKHIDHVKREILNMTNKGSGTGHDDCCDNVSDLCAIEFSGAGANYEQWV